MAKTPGLTGKAAQALKHLEESSAGHRSWIDKVERRYDAFLGVMPQNSKAAQWTSKLAPPYAKHIVETSVASLVEDKLTFRVNPRPRFYEPGEYEASKDGAKAHEMVLSYQLAADRFDEKQRWFVLQEAVAGLTVAKVYWKEETRLKKGIDFGQKEIVDEETGTVIGSIPNPRVVEKPDVMFDGPCVEVVDVRDFFWDEASVSLDTCPIMAHRVWKTFDECKQREALGMWKNVDDLGESGGISSGAQGSYASEADRTKDRIEILEIWRREKNKIVVYEIGNRNVLLRKRDHPYWHGEMPFIGCATQSNLFRIPGMSQVEKIAALQEALWTIENQRIDNVALLNSAVVITNSALIDPEDIEIYPGSVIESDDPGAVQLWQPNPTPATVSLPTESMIRENMQNLSGGFPFTSSSEARNVGANTATEASLVTSLAQRSLIATKTQLNHAWRRIGQQMLELNQQYVRDPIYVNVLGIDSEVEVKRILPQMLQGSFAFDIQPMNDSLMRNEKRAEAQTLFTALLQQAQVLQMTGAPLNTKALVEDLLDAWDKPNPERYFAEPQQPPKGQPGQQPDQPQPGQEGQGVTSPLASGPMSPSNQNSQSPEVMMQQFLAAQGGGRSA